MESAASIWRRTGYVNAKSNINEPLWFEWLALLGILAFGSWILGIRGVWSLLVVSDPTGITVVIILVFLGSTLWCGSRAKVLSKQLELLQQSKSQLSHSPESLIAVEAAASPSWAVTYWRNLHATPQALDTALDILMSNTHGPHSTAWWVNAIQLKLGLLGKVIGFSILALNIGQMQNFDASQSQELLKNLTSGLGVALLTTMVGLVGNILLGAQLTRLDRFADNLVEQAQQLGLQMMSQLGKS
jgi:biopolymer transport protein ExbB/TolQ